MALFSLIEAVNFCITFIFIVALILIEHFYRVHYLYFQKCSLHITPLSKQNSTRYFQILFTVFAGRIQLNVVLLLPHTHYGYEEKESCQEEGRQEEGDEEKVEVQEALVALDFTF